MLYYYYTLVPYLVFFLLYLNSTLGTKYFPTLDTSISQSFPQSPRLGRILPSHARLGRILPSAHAMAAPPPTMDAANATHREPRGARPGSPARPENAPFSRRSCGAFSRRSAHSPTEEIGAVRPGERTILPEIGTSAQRNLAALATTIHRTLLLTTAQYTWARQGT